MVVRTLWTPAKAARQAATQLKRIGTNIIGGIMNGVSHGRGYYPYYYGYYGYYSYRYDDERAGARHGGGLRTWGLGIEEAAREHLQNLRYRLPRLAAEASRLARGFARRPLFWLLLALLVGLTVVERRLRPNRDDGPAGIRLLQADTPGVAMEAPGGIEIVRPLAAKQHTAPDATDEQGAESARALSDSMDLWAAALHRGDTLTALRFYDLGRVSVRLQDAVPGGEERLRHWLSSVATDSILVESAWLSTYAPPICTSEVVLATDRHGDTTRTAALLAWERNSGRWRIVAQRCSSPRRESNAR
jgi:hypothetical protein